MQALHPIPLSQPAVQRFPQDLADLFRADFPFRTGNIFSFDQFIDLRYVYIYYLSLIIHFKAVFQLIFTLAFPEDCFTGIGSFRGFSLFQIHTAGIDHKAFKFIAEIVDQLFQRFRLFFIAFLISIVIQVILFHIAYRNLKSPRHFPTLFSFS